VSVRKVRAGYLMVLDASTDVLDEGEMNHSKQLPHGRQEEVSSQRFQQGKTRTHQGTFHCMLVLAAACTAGLGSHALAQSLNHLSAETKAAELPAAVDTRASLSWDELDVRLPEADVHTAASNSSSPMVVSAIAQPVVQNKPPDLTANPGRPAMATSALLTPVGYAQFESGVLYAAGSAQFYHRSAEEQTMRLTVAPSLQFILSSEPVAYSSTSQEELTQRGDAQAGLQMILMPGQGLRPTISGSYLHLLKGGTASSLDIGGYANSALLMASADLGHFHVDDNVFLNETEGAVRRAQWGHAVAVSHAVTAKVGGTAELRYFTEPLTGGTGLSALWAANYSIRPNLVFDTGLVHGLTGTSTQWQVASGFTYVLPHKIWSFSRTTDQR
jgi:hypothetical protein